MSIYLICSCHFYSCCTLTLASRPRKWGWSLVVCVQVCLSVCPLHYTTDTLYRPFPTTGLCTCTFFSILEAWCRQICNLFTLFYPPSCSVDIYICTPSDLFPWLACMCITFLPFSLLSILVMYLCSFYGGVRSLYSWYTPSMKEQCDDLLLWCIIIVPA